MKIFVSGLVLVAAVLATAAEPAGAAKPKVSVGDVTVGESAGSAAVGISLSKKTKRAVRLTLTTADGTAQAQVDYGPVTKSLKIGRGKRSATLEIPVLADTIVETPDETFAVRVTKVKRAKLRDGEAIVTIVDDDAGPGGGGGGPPAVPTLSLVTNTLPEGGAGTHPRQIDVSLDAPSSTGAVVDWSLVAGSATAGQDFSPAGGTVVIPAGQTTGSFAIDVLGDATDEPDETLSVALSNPVGVQLAETSHGLTIADDDDPPIVTVTTASVTEGTSGNHVHQVDVGLSAASAKPITVSYATASGTATSGADFTAANGTLDFAPGDTTKTFDLTTVGDYADEADETVAINLSSPINVSLPGTAQAVTILDDDPPCVAPDAPGTATNLGPVNGDTDNPVHQVVAVSDIFPCVDRDWYRFVLFEDSGSSRDLTARITLQSGINDSPSSGDIDLCVQIGVGGTPVCSTGGPGVTEAIDLCNQEDLGSDSTEYFVLVDGFGNAVNFNYTLTITGNITPGAAVQISDC